MFATNRSAALWGGFLLAALGVAFCAWAALAPSESLCVSTGCALYRDLTAWGVSLWWYGAGAFTLLALFCLFGKHEVARGFAWLMLAADTALLALMALTAPCAACLVVASLIAGAFMAIPAARRRGQQRSISMLLLAWSGLFLANGAALSAEQLGAWDLQGPERAPVTLYFSPSCPACRQVIAALATAPPDTVAYRPVAENADDIATIDRMRRSVERGMPVAEALLTATDRPAAHEMSLPEHIHLRWKLLRNRVRVLSIGADRLPVLQIAGMPRLPLGSGADGATSAAPRQYPSLPEQHQDGASLPAPGAGHGALLPFLANDFAGCAQLPGSNATCD